MTMTGFQNERMTLGYVETFTRPEGAMYDDPLDELLDHAPAVMAALNGKPEPCLVIPDACRCGDLIDRRGSFHVIQGIPYCSKCFSRMAANGGRVPEHFQTNTGEP